MNAIWQEDETNAGFIMETENKRILGEEWKTWDGELIPPEEIRVGASFFLILLFLCIVFLICLAFFALYLISPRLSQYSMQLPTYMTYVLGAISIIGILWFMILVLFVKTGHRTFCFCLGNKFFLEISSVAARFGRRLGLSKDKLGHSFIRLSNAVTLAAYKSKTNQKVLLLLPRCLAKDARNRVLEICSKFGVETKTAGGGEAALQFVREVNPDAVIGIACERDLMNGIQDVAPKIPVFGIPNLRPKGPCQATHIEYEELEKALATICGE